MTPTMPKAERQRRLDAIRQPKSEPTPAKVETMKALLQALPEMERRALTAYYVDGLDPATAAARSGLTPEGFSAIRADLRGKFLAKAGAICR